MLQAAVLVVALPALAVLTVVYPDGHSVAGFGVDVLGGLWAGLVSSIVLVPLFGRFLSLFDHPL